MRKVLVVSVLVFFASVCHGANDLEKGILREMNLARTAPKAYAAQIKEFRRHFKGKYYILPGSHVRTITEEGTSAVEEALRFLSRQKPLPPLNWGDGLSKAATDLAEEQEKSGAIGHEGEKTGGMQDRIERHGSWTGTIGENISYGPGDPRMVVMQLIIDDGVPNRGHRANIFSPKFTTAGVGCRSHPELRTVCVMDFARRFAEQ